MRAPPNEAPYPENPVVVRVRRGGAVESVHRGAWVVVDDAGEVLAGAGGFEAPIFARSAIKALQALPLLETGAAERFGFSAADLALAAASHGGEPCHTSRVAATLARMGLEERHLRCGVHPPSDARARAALEREGAQATQLHNNCSGKHVGFLALALHLGADPARYLEPGSPGQVLVRRALAEMADLAPEELVPAVDGCSAPTYRLPLRSLALAFARLTRPDGLPPARRERCRQLTEAVARHPQLLGATAKRLCTDLVVASGGRLFPKIGAEAVYALGLVGAGRALALKVDDGGSRALPVLVLGLLESLGWLDEAELGRLSAWRGGVLRNHAGLEVGSIEPVLP